MSVCLVDTSILCNLIPVPGRDQDQQAVEAGLTGHINKGVALLLPLAAVLETGNHVARLADGRQRRKVALRFSQMVREAIEGKTPFTPTPFFEPDAVRHWLDEFPDAAMRGLGLADLSIIKEFKRQCELHPHRRVFIWSLDRHLASYQRPARTPAP